MKTIFFVINLCFLILTNCGKDLKTPESEAVQTETSEVTITAKTINGLKYTDYALSPEAENAVIGWEKYNELAIQINYLINADLSFFNGDEKLLNEFITNLRIMP